MKKLVVGDPHGNYEGLKHIVELAELEDNDKIILVGDYVDHFPGIGGNVRKLLDLIISLKKKYVVYPIIGNHDFWMRKWIIEGNIFPEKVWYIQGGKETLKSYNIGLEYYNLAKERIPKKHVHFLTEELHPFYIDKDMVVVHGGLTSFHQMDWVKYKQPDQFWKYKKELFEIMWDRSFYTHITMVNSLNKKYTKNFGNRIFICGHTPRGPEYRKSNEIKKLLIDGGSKGGGSLHAALFDSNNLKEFSIISESGEIKLQEV